MVINNLEYKFNLKNRKFEIKLKSNLFIELRKNTVKKSYTRKCSLTKSISISPT